MLSSQNLASQRRKRVDLRMGRLVFWMGDTAPLFAERRGRRDWARVRGACGDLESRPRMKLLIGRIDGWPRFCFPRRLPRAPSAVKKHGQVSKAAGRPLSVQDKPCQCLDLGQSTSHHDAAAASQPGDTSIGWIGRSGVVSYPMRERNRAHRQAERAEFKILSRIRIAWVVSALDSDAVSCGCC